MVQNLEPISNKMETTDKMTNLVMISKIYIHILYFYNNYTVVANTFDIMTQASSNLLHKIPRLGILASFW